jgi:hypothetical protein
MHTEVQQRCSTYVSSTTMPDNPVKQHCIALYASEALTSLNCRWTITVNYSQLEIGLPEPPSLKYCVRDLAALQLVDVVFALLLRQGNCSVVVDNAHLLDDWAWELL